MQTEKSQPEGKRIMPETRFTEKSQPEGKRIMPETGFTSFPALSVYTRVGISRSASETNDRFYLSALFPSICIFSTHYRIVTTDSSIKGF